MQLKYNLVYILHYFELHTNKSWTHYTCIEIRHYENIKVYVLLCILYYRYCCLKLQFARKKNIGKFPKLKKAQYGVTLHIFSEMIKMCLEMRFFLPKIRQGPPPLTHTHTNLRLYVFIVVRYHLYHGSYVLMFLLLNSIA